MFSYLFDQLFVLFLINFFCFFLPYTQKSTKNGVYLQKSMNLVAIPLYSGVNNAHLARLRYTGVVFISGGCKMLSNIKTTV